MPEQSNNPKLVTIFHSYAHQDSVLRDAVEKALAGVKHVKNFHDDSTLPGEEWEKKVLPQLDAADIVVLHISPDFVYSSWCNAEMNRALENMKKHRSRVIPVHLRPFYWPDRPIKHLQALPEDAKPVTEWPNQDAAFVSVARGIERVINDILNNDIPQSAEPREVPETHFQPEPLPPLLPLPVPVPPLPPLLLPRIFAACAGIAIVALALLLQHLAYAFDIAQSSPGLEWFSLPLDPAYWYLRKSRAVIHRANTYPLGVVTLRRGTDPDDILDNVCPQRGYVASLLAKIASMPPPPRVVVLDKYYLEDSCLAPSPETGELHHAIDLLTRRGTNVVIGQDSDQFYVLQQPIYPDHQLLAPGQVDFVRLHPGVRMGLIRLNFDVQKLPLTWPAFASQGQLDSAVETPTLALAAARAYQPDIDSNPMVSRMLTELDHPLVSFSPASEFSSTSARKVLCGDDPNPDWHSCGRAAPLPDTLRKPVLFIGNDVPGPVDYFDTSAGKMPGVFLQANYTLSLLEGRFYAPVPTWMEFVVATLFILLAEFGMRRPRTTPESALLWSILLFVAAQAAVIALLVQQRDYLPVWTPLLPLFLARYAIERWDIPGPLRRLLPMRETAAPTAIGLPGTTGAFHS